MKILISAAEASSDAHGAQLLKALKKQGAVSAFGIGGPKLQAEGLQPVVDASELLSMGFTEILGRLPRILRAARSLVDAAQIQKPDVAVVIDYPDFHFRVARELKKLGIPVIYYIPPKVWVWRKSRVQILKSRFRKILCIFPFEKKFYEAEGVDVCYVGNPLSEEMDKGLTRESARRELHLAPSDRVLLLMPGSRPAEVNSHLGLMLDSALHALARMRSQQFFKSEEILHVLIPVPATFDQKRLEKGIEDWKRIHGDVRAVQIQMLCDREPGKSAAHLAMAAADAGLIKSGTATLEAAWMGLPHGIVYRPHLLTTFIFKFLIRYWGPVGLSNIVLSPENRPWLIHELLMNQATVKNLSNEIIELFTNSNRRNALLSGMASIRDLLSPDKKVTASEKAAEEVWKCGRQGGLGVGDP